MNTKYSRTGKFITDIAYRLTALTVKTICRINGGFVVKGKENMPKEGGVLIASNHISYLDPPVVGSASPRRVTFMARRGLFDVPVLGRAIKYAAFPVDREKTLPSTIKETVRRLRNGEVIAIFPEGKRSETGELLQAKRGAGVVAAMSRVPVVPALVIGTDRALPLHAKWLKRAKITVVFGKPIYYTSNQEGKDHPGHSLHDEISGRIMQAIRDLKADFEENHR